MATLQSLSSGGSGNEKMNTCTTFYKICQKKRRLQYSWCWYCLIRVDTKNWLPNSFQLLILFRSDKRSLSLSVPFLLQKRFTFSQETIRIICHYSVTIIVRQDRWWTGFFSPSFLCTAIIAACFEISNTRSQHWWQLTSASASIW